MARNLVTGIDVGTSLVKAVIVDPGSKNGKGLPMVIGVGMTESRGLRHGYVTNVKDVADSVRRAVALAEEKAGCKIKRAFLGIGGIGLGSTAVTSTVMTSRADAEITSLDLEKMRDQAEKDIPRSAIANRRIIYDIPLSYKVDGQTVLGDPVGLSGNKLERKSLFVTCLDHHVSDLIRAVNEAGIEVERTLRPAAEGHRPRL